VGRETIGTAVGRVDGFLVKKVGLELGSLDGNWDGLAESGIAVGMNEGSIVSGAISEKQICHPPLVTLKSVVKVNVVPAVNEFGSISADSTSTPLIIK
jgi:hypothetical protein